MIIRIHDTIGKMRNLNALCIVEAEQFEGYTQIHLTDGRLILTVCPADLVTEAIVKLIQDPPEGGIADLTAQS